MHSLDALFNSVAALPPSFESEVIAKAVGEQFGLVGQYRPLVSERDQNFRLETADGARYVVKITSFAENPLVTDFQITALLHLEQFGLTGVPRIVRTRRGGDRGIIRSSNDGDEAVLRVVTWLDGELLSDANVTPEICHRFGCRLADLDIALENFSHEGDRQDLLWDMQRAAELGALLIHIDNRDVRQLVEEVLNVFETSAGSALKELACQVIHNDANGENVLLDEQQELSGFIDFGDMLRAPRIVDVATAAAYLRTIDGDPLRLLVPFVAGYNERNPLSELESDLLYDLIRTRLAMTLLILYWRVSARQPGDPYREKSLQGEATAFDFLQNLTTLGRAAFRERILDEKSFKNK
jgi:Ser/Thr protein kinase RdoA (MazF antagonist)